VRQATVNGNPFRSGVDVRGYSPEYVDCFLTDWSLESPNHPHRLNRALII
jgi:hypothetical protein